MSDSDDTDVLLLIPPDFFNVELSDYESFDEDSKAERSVVNDLISHVNNLENRISQIENKDGPRSSLEDLGSAMHSSSGSSHLNTRPAAKPGTSHTGRRFASSSLTNSDPNLNLSPSRRATRFNSLPPTPSSSSIRSYAPSTAYSSGIYNTSPQKYTVSDGLTTSPSKSNGSLYERNFGSKAGSREKDTLAEVDKFLESLKKDSGRQYGSKELVSDGLPPSPQKKNSAADGVAQLQLNEVDRLLREVEAEQRNIEARLSGHDAPEIRKIVQKPGENIGSIPDLGFGVRQHWGDVDKFLESERAKQPRLQPQVQPQRQPAEESVAHARKMYKPGELIGSIPDLGYGVREAWAETNLPRKQTNLMSHAQPDGAGVESPIVPKNATMLHSGHDDDNSYEEKLPKQTPKVFTSRRKLDLDASPTSTSHFSRSKDMSSVNDSHDDAVDQGPLSSLDSVVTDPGYGGQTNRSRNKRAAATAAAVVAPSGATASDNPRTTDGSKPLMSLAELWSDGSVHSDGNTDNTKLLQKYEEECLRRQHCEQLVQALQAKLLESQQKLAVALRVDTEKDLAIKKLQGAWRSLADHWRTLEDQRHDLSRQLQSQKTSSDAQVKQMQQKLDRCETELSKVLDLAHGYKEQFEHAEKVHAAQLEQLGSKIQEVERRLAAAVQARAESQVREDSFRKQLEQDHNTLVHLQAAMEAATKSLSTREADAAVLTEEKAALQTRLKEERNRIDTLQQSRDKLKIELEESVKRERNLQNELKKVTGQIESSKVELHDFYQAQLERVVRDKLKEFQAQLDTAESTLQKELESRERSVAQLAARQLQHVTEKHRLEVSLLEQKHGEELRLMRLQQAEARRQVQDLETRLAAYEKRNSNLAERFHGLMENQWREALNIISSPTSQVDNKAKAMKDLQASFGGEDHSKDKAWMLVQQQQRSQLNSTAGSGELGPPGPTSPPVQGSADGVDDLKKYIKMLLERPPGNPVDGAPAPQLSADSVLSKGSNSGSHPQTQSAANSNKPPWK